MADIANLFFYKIDILHSEIPAFLCRFLSEFFIIIKHFFVFYNGKSEFFMRTKQTGFPFILLLFSVPCCIMTAKEEYKMKTELEKKKSSLSGFRMWLLVWGLGLAGQICWNMENQWFNTFVYAKIGKDPSIITGMLILSAAATTFSTFFFGTWADRTGKRRMFISVGYILWGVFTIAFGLTQFISASHYLLAAVSVVLADTVMSFFGSMGNDAGFNTWTNDIMTDKNRGQIGAALATQPILGTILGTVVGGLLVGQNDNYMRLFLVMGIFVIVFGVISMFTMTKADDVEPSKRGSFGSQFLSVFNFRRFFTLKELVWVNLAVSVFFIGFNVYFAYMGNYIIYYLGYTPDLMGIIEAVPLMLASAMLRFCRQPRYGQNSFTRRTARDSLRESGFFSSCSFR